jgi:hypothetical protein
VLTLKLEELIHLSHGHLGDDKRFRRRHQAFLSRKDVEFVQRGLDFRVPKQSFP